MTASAASTSALRHRTDPHADALASTLLAGDDARHDRGRLGYNHLLDIADVLLESPELRHAPGSRVTASLQSLAPELVTWFDPIPLPEWVDEAALERASQLWMANMLPTLAVLYARSLPACYLIEHGLPALYATGRLANKRYLYQRLYETGLMLDAVLSPGGLCVMHDIEENLDEHLAAVLADTHPDQQFTREQHKLHAGNRSQPLDNAAIAAALEQHHHSRRFLAGPGFIAARKVRFLHAAMRYMLCNPHDCDEAYSDDPVTLAEAFARETWDADSHGAPVNQQDLLYTLLTFAVDIPEGLAHWGIRISAQQREDFLHTWRLVGHVMGIDDQLLPTTWDEATRHYREISSQQARASEAGREMTETLMQFLEDYIPERFGLRRALPALLIADQLGERSTELLGEDCSRLREGRFARWAFRFGMQPLRLYFYLSRTAFTLIPPIRMFIGELFYRVGMAFVASWRDVYQRRPFYVPDDIYGWKLKQGVNVSFLRELAAWRNQVFDAICIGVASWLIALLVLTGAVVLWLLHAPGVTASLWLGVTLSLSALYLCNVRVPLVMRARPRIPSDPCVATGKTAASASA